MQDQFKKGPLGHALDFRKAMGRLQETTRMWCQAFDVGDVEALETYTYLFREAMEDTLACGTAYDKAMKEAGEE